MSSSTNYNLVMAVLSMFFMLVKGTMYMLHVLPPIVSAILHAVLIALYSVAVAFQGSSDTTDPSRPQHGPPWMVTESCSVAHDKSLIGYCQQAKATFACFVAMIGIFFIYLVLSVWSCFPTKAHKLEYEEKQRAKKLRWAHLDEPDTRELDSDYPPETPGLQSGMYPVTPRTLAFNKLGGTKDLPLRTQATTTTKTSTFALRSPGILRTPMTLVSPRENKEVTTAEAPISPNPEAQMYFPPPPKESTSKSK